MIDMPPTLAALQLLLLATSATAIPASAIFARQEASCDARGFERCGDDFPDYFCCPSGSTCMALAGDTTVMCCPDNKDCDSLGPVTCNIRAQDAERDHTLPLKTTVFDVELERCGDDGCCPFGFTCEDGKDGKICEKADDQSEKPGRDGNGDDEDTSTSFSSTRTSEPTSTSEPSSGPRSTTDINPTATNDESDQGNSSDSDSGPDTTSIIGGVVGACAVLLIVAVVLFVCVRKRAKRSPARTPPPPQPPTSQALHGRNISGPTNVTADIGRTEFLQKREHEPGEGLDDQEDGLGVMNPRPANPSFLHRLSSRFSRDMSDRGSTQFPFGSNSPNPSLPETPLERVPSHEILRKGSVTRSSIPPIRSMKSAVRTKSRHLHPEMARDIPRDLTPRPPRPTRTGDDAASDTIPIMTEAQDDDHSRSTTFEYMKKAAGLGGVGETSTFVHWQGCTPRV